MDIVGDVLRSRIHRAVFIDNILDTRHVVTYRIKLGDSAKHILVSRCLGGKQGIVFARMDVAEFFKGPGLTGVNIRRNCLKVGGCPAVDVH